MLRAAQYALYGFAGGLEMLAVLVAFNDGDPALGWGLFVAGLGAWTAASLAGTLPLQARRRRSLRA